MLLKQCVLRPGGEWQIMGHAQCLGYHCTVSRYVMGYHVLRECMQELFPAPWVVWPWLLRIWAQPQACLKFSPEMTPSCPPPLPSFTNSWEFWDWRSQLCWLSVWFLPLSHLPAFLTTKTMVDRVVRIEYSLGVGEGEAGTNATDVPVVLWGEDLLCNPWGCSCAWAAVGQGPVLKERGASKRWGGAGNIAGSWE